MRFPVGTSIVLYGQPDDRRYGIVLNVEEHNGYGGGTYQIEWDGKETLFNSIQFIDEYCEPTWEL